jgi:hypothetical protein
MLAAFNNARLCSPLAACLAFSLLLEQELLGSIYSYVSDLSRPVVIAPFARGVNLF